MKVSVSVSVRSSVFPSSGEVVRRAADAAARLDRSAVVVAVVARPATVLVPEIEKEKLCYITLITHYLSQYENTFFVSLIMRELYRQQSLFFHIN